MSASEYLNKELFHGTSALLPIGGVLEPGAPEDEGGAAYATPDLETAKKYARRRSMLAGSLFGNVYHVRPISPNPQVNDYSDGAGFVEVADPKGMEIVALVDSPINPNAAAQ
jgi:hypothetical protein